MIQVVGQYPALPIPAIKSHLPNPVAAYRQHITASPTSSPNQPHLTISSGRHQKVVTNKMLSTALALTLDGLSLDSSLYSLHCDIYI